MIGVRKDPHRADLRCSIVVAGDQDDGQFAVCGYLANEIRKSTQSSLRRREPVENVSRNNQRIGPMLGDGRLDLRDNRIMIAFQAYPVELASQVPIARVQDTHTL
ncbi:hypothetical protein LTR94_032878, partial [Friedmanniomyces endolithicus]